MTKFSALVLEAFKGSDFTPATGVANDEFVALLRRESEQVCSYIFFRDDRRGGGAVAVDYWVAPPDFPDDGLDKLGIGFKVAIARAFGFQEDLLRVARRRVDILGQVVPAFTAAVTEEAKAPIVVTPRLGPYRDQIALYRIVMRRSADKSGRAIAEALQSAADSLQKGRPYRDFASKCQEILALLTQCDDLAPEEAALLAKPEMMVHTMLSRHLYVEMLVPFGH
ncbi:MAG TPA: hypothetical protein VHE82_02385 [Gemmatimonadaceae bacterium]|nr:hypothetical protein [Gemmatimonadaceae bacterium]